MFKKILIANRGEIAVRIVRACRELGIRVAAVFSEPDREARHVQLADEAWVLTGQPARAYLDIPQIIELARRSGSQAIHPGYGFLSENAEFAEAVAQAGLIFIGPQPEVIRRMGNKVEARRMMGQAGVPLVPGTTEPVGEVEVLKQLATKYGYPVAIKAAAGGGGRGLRVVAREEELESAFAGAVREGTSYFGDGRVYVEKYLHHPRHIEVQVLADNHGNTVWLGERDCSTQRRHQKLLEETPGANLPDDLRERLLNAAVAGARSIGYTSAGTLEFLVFGNEFYFLEVNTRIQVEHPITEYVTGIDLVKEQIAIASGAPLSFNQADVQPRGHAIECRINAEDPSKNFMPSPGKITSYSEPQMPWVRVDSACYEGYTVLPFYDSLLAKLVVWGRHRQEAICRTREALKGYEIGGLPTTIPFHLMLLDEPAFKSGEVYTTYVETEMKKRLTELSCRPISGAAAGAVAESTSASLAPPPAKAQQFEVDVNQRRFKVSVSTVACAESEPRGPVQSPGTSLRKKRPLGSNNNHDTVGNGEIRSEMHGLVKEILVKEGEAVAAGQKLMIFEAMKMESEILSRSAGKVLRVNVSRGETVEAAALLMVVGAK